MAKVDLTNPIFHDNDAARDHLEKLLWPTGPVCPRCGSIDNAAKLKGKSTRPGVYKCRGCRKPFSVTVGTVMERSKIPLAKWVLAAQLMASSKKGFSANELHRILGTTYETAWFLFHRLREAATDHTPSPLGGEGKVIEADETYVGGKEKNKHASKRKHRGRGAVGKAPVVSLVERDGKTRSFHIANVTAATLRPVLVKHINASSSLMTDESAVYPSIGKAFAKHASVNHSAGEYVGLGTKHHTNTVESHFALFKRGLIGTFHNVSEAHLPRYLAEFDFRANTRSMTDADRANALLVGAKGKRLTYHQTD